MTENERKRALLPVEIEYVPDHADLTQTQWNQWCEEHDFYPLGAGPGSRGAWISDLNTYLRGADVLIYSGGALIDVGDSSDLQIL